MTDPRDADALRLASASLAAGDATGWFERLYAESRDGSAIVPWDRETPNALLVSWAGSRSGDGRRAVAVGCGSGRDAEFVASLGYATTAFDIAASAIELAHDRHPASLVSYHVADLFALPSAWLRAFDLVVESQDVQALPPRLHARASAAVSSLLAPGGTLLVLAAAGDGSADGPPWPVTRAELDGFAVDGVELVSVENIVRDGAPRWRAEFHRSEDGKGTAR